MAETRARFPWGLTVVCALAFALLVSLGVWQVQRLQWKATLIAGAEAAAAEPPVELAQLVNSGLPEFRKVRLTCPGLDTAPFVELQTIEQGQAGVRLISPCVTRHVYGGETHSTLFLVDRGFVMDTISARPPETGGARAVEVVAEIRRAPPPGPMAPASEGRRFYARDITAMARALPPGDRLPREGGAAPGAVKPVTLFALTSSNPEWAALKPSAPPAAFSNNHLGYAITWFGLALALVGFYIALLRRKLSLKPPRSASKAAGKKESS